MPDNQTHRIEKLVGNCENWHEVGSSGEPAFANSWVNYDASLYPACGFYKDPFGVVHLQGLAKSGTVGAAMFTLPVGYRPSGFLHLVAQTNTGHGMVNVDIDGLVYAATGGNGYFSLAGITFRV